MEAMYLCTPIHLWRLRLYKNILPSQRGDDIGWACWTSGMIGTIGMNKKIEAIELRLV